MSNRNVVLNQEGKIVGEYHTSLACFMLVHQLLDKYNPGRSLMFEAAKADEMLEPVYQKCEGFEEVQLLLFINSESHFDQGDIPKFDEAIDRYSFGNDGPKKHLVFIRDLLQKYEKLTTKYMDTTFAMAVGVEA